MSTLKFRTVALLLLSVLITINCQINQYMEEMGRNGEDIWRSTSDFIPVQSQSFGTIKLGHDMSMEFDFYWLGRSNDPNLNKYEMFFRVGFDAMNGNGCNGQGARYPSFWIKDTSDTLHLSVSDGSSCHPSYDLSEYGIITIATIYHIKISFNDTLLMIDISGPKPDWRKIWERNATLSQYIGRTAPVWWMSNKYGDLYYNRGNATFSNVTITSYNFTGGPTRHPTIEPTFDPTFDPTSDPTFDPTTDPTKNPTVIPSTDPTIDPITDPTINPTVYPTYYPSIYPTIEPTMYPTIHPTIDPTMEPTFDPTTDPTSDPTFDPTSDPTFDPTSDPTFDPTTDPTQNPTVIPSADPTIDPTDDPTKDPTTDPTKNPTVMPSNDPTIDPTSDPTSDPTFDPTMDPTFDPTMDPTFDPTFDPTSDPTFDPTFDPTQNPTSNPSTAPTTTSMPTTLKPTATPSTLPTTSTVNPSTVPTTKLATTTSITTSTAQTTSQELVTSHSTATRERLIIHTIYSPSEIPTNKPTINGIKQSSATSKGVDVEHTDFWNDDLYAYVFYIAIVLMVILLIAVAVCIYCKFKPPKISDITKDDMDESTENQQDLTIPTSENTSPAVQPNGGKPFAFNSNMTETTSVSITSDDDDDVLNDQFGGKPVSGDSDERYIVEMTLKQKQKRKMEIDLKERGLNELAMNDEYYAQNIYNAQQQDTVLMDNIVYDMKNSYDRHQNNGNDHYHQ